MNISEILGQRDNQVTNVEDDINTRKNSSCSAQTQEAEDAKTFNELMQECKNTQNTEIKGKVTETDSLDKVDEGLLKKIKKNENKNDELQQFFNLQGINYSAYVPDSKDIDFKNKLDLNLLSGSDIKSVKTILENPNMTIFAFNAQNQQINLAISDNSGQISYKSLDFSKTLFNLIDYSYKTQKPIRLDFEGNSSVILKIDKEGKLSAEFIAGTRGMEILIKENIQNLRNKLDSEGVFYKEITYRENNKRQNKKQDKGD